MARARNIKPGFFTNDELAEIEPLGRLLFIGMWTLADREGRLEDRPKRIKAEVLPYDDCDVNTLLNELQKHGFIIRYCVDKRLYIQIVNFLKHQNPHQKEQETTIPAPNLSDASTVQEQEKHETSPADSLNLIPDSLNLIPETNTLSKPDVSCERVKEIFDCWKFEMDSPRSVLDNNRKRIIQNALKDRTEDELKKAIRGCAKSPYHMGFNDKKTKYNGIDLIFRNAEKIEKFMQFDDCPPSRASPDMLKDKKSKDWLNRLTGNYGNERTIIDIN